MGWRTLWFCVCARAFQWGHYKNKIWKDWLLFHSVGRRIISKLEYQWHEQKGSLHWATDRRGDGKGLRLCDTRSFLASNYKLWWGQILSVDPQCWNFLTKPQEANWGHCRSAATGIKSKKQQNQHTVSLRLGGERGYQCKEKGKGVNFRSGVCQNLLQPRWCISVNDCSRQVKLWTWLPSPQCPGIFSHIRLWLGSVGSWGWGAAHCSAPKPCRASSAVPATARGVTLL